MSRKLKIFILITSIVVAVLAAEFFRPESTKNSLLEFITLENIFYPKDPGDSARRFGSETFDYSRRVRFSIVSYSLPEKIYAKGKVIEKYLEENLGLEVKIIVLRNYESLIDLLKIGQVEVVWASPLIYRNIKNEINYNLLLKLLEHGAPYYEGAIIVRKDSQIKEIKDLKGRSMAFVDENSASGFYLQNRLINEQGFSALTFFSRFEFVGSHDLALQMVYNKKFDAASLGLQLMNFDAGMKSDEIMVLAKTPKIPNAPILVNNNIDKSLRDRLYELLLHPEKFKGGKEFLKDLANFDSFTGFVNADTSEYEF